MRKRRVVTSIKDASANIASYASAAHQNSELAARLSKHPSWYAVKDAAAHWIFGPSKFVGYHGMTVEDYLSGYDRKDGRETEPALLKLFTPVDPDSALGVELRDAFTRFAANLGKAPNARWRVSVTPEEHSSRASFRPDLSERIDFHPEICGGRPRIKGTRVRVSDIIAALGAGERIPDILENFPYLAEADIYAALEYAANAVDHRILRAA